MLYPLTPRVTDHVLGSQLLGHLGCTANGQVLVWPVTYLYDGQAIYGHIQEGELTQLLRQNPAVCFEADEVISPFDWRSVLVQGVYEELQGEERLYIEQRLGPARNAPVYTQTTPDMGSGRQAKTVVYRIRIRNKTGYHQQRQAPAINPSYAPGW